jgi:hypothetical protein
MLLTFEAYAGTGGGQKPSSPPQQPSPQVPPASPSETLPQPSPTPAAVPPAPANGTTQPSPNNALQNPLAWGGAVALGGLGIGSVVVGLGINKFMDQRLAPALVQVGESVGDKVVNKVDERVLQGVGNMLKNSGASYAHNAKFIVDAAGQPLQFVIQENGECRQLPADQAVDPQHIYRVKQVGNDLRVVNSAENVVDNLSPATMDKVYTYVHQNAQISKNAVRVLSETIAEKVVTVADQRLGQPLEKIITSSGVGYHHNATYILNNRGETLEFSVGDDGRIIGPAEGRPVYRVKQQGGELVAVDLNGQEAAIHAEALRALPNYVHQHAVRSETALQVITKQAAAPLVDIAKRDIVVPLMTSLNDNNIKFLHIGNRMLDQTGKVLEFTEQEGAVVPVQENLDPNTSRYQVQQVDNGQIKVFDHTGQDCTNQFQGERLKRVQNYMSNHGLKPESAVQIITKTLTGEVRSTVEQIVQKDIKPLIEPFIKSLTSKIPAYRTSLLGNKNLLVDKENNPLKIPMEGPTLQLRRKQVEGVEEFEFVKSGEVIQPTGHLTETLARLKKLPKDSLTWSENILSEGGKPRTFFEDASGRGENFYHVRVNDNEIQFLDHNKQPVVLQDNFKPQAERFLRDHAPLADNAFGPIVDRVMEKIQVEKITQELVPKVKEILDKGQAQIAPTLASLQTIIKDKIEPLIQNHVDPLIKDLAKFAVGPTSVLAQTQAAVNHISGLLGLDMVTVSIDADLQKITNNIKTSNTSLELQLMVEHEMQKFDKTAAELASGNENAVAKFEAFRKTGVDSQGYKSLDISGKTNFRKEFAKYENYRGQLMHQLKAALESHALKNTVYHKDLMLKLQKGVEAANEMHSITHPSGGYVVSANSFKQAAIPEEKPLLEYTKKFAIESTTQSSGWFGSMWASTPSSTKTDKESEGPNIIQMLNKHGLAEVVRPVFNQTVSEDLKDLQKNSEVKPALFNRVFDHLMTQHLEGKLSTPPLDKDNPHEALVHLADKDKLGHYQAAAQYKASIHQLIKLAEQHQSSLPPTSEKPEITGGKQEVSTMEEKVAAPAKAESHFTPDALRKRFADVPWHDPKKTAAHLDKHLQELQKLPEYHTMNQTGLTKTPHPIVEHITQMHEMIKNTSPRS